MTQTVVAPDGSHLGVELVGAGPRVLFVHGGTADRTRWARLAEHLRHTMTLCLLDRRGRGLSIQEAGGPYSWRREAADVAAVVEALGTRAVVGHSYGGLCTLGALGVTNEIDRLVVYEPTVPAPGHPIIPPGVLERIETLLGSGRRDDALSLFFTGVVGASAEDVAQRRGTPDWHARLAALPTALREGAALASADPDALGLQDVATPVTVMVGTATAAPLAAAARVVAGHLPHGRLVELAGCGHTAMDQAPAGFADALLDALDVTRV